MGERGERDPGGGDGHAASPLAPVCGRSSRCSWRGRGRLGWVSLSKPLRLARFVAGLTVFGVAVVAEILSDKIPVVDHVLDVLGGSSSPPPARSSRRP